MSDPEHALVERLRQGDRRAFDELYRQHEERIWRFLVRLSGRRDDAADLF